MLVSHLNSVLDGGAATAARRLHESLLERGISSRFCYSSDRTVVDPQAQTSQLGETYQAVSWQNASRFQRLVSASRYRYQQLAFRRALYGRSGAYEIFTSPRNEPPTPWPPTGGDAPLIRSEEGMILNLHWIAKFLDYPSFFGSLSSQQPVVWTLHDMNAFTGGCHFSDGCMAFREGCGNCPQLSRRGPNDISRKAFEVKSRTLSRINLHVVAPSRWLFDLARSSRLLRSARSFHHIPYGVPTSQFYPNDRAIARQNLGLDPNAFLIGFGAMELSNRRKGCLDILRAFESLDGDGSVQAVALGDGELPSDFDLGLPFRSLGQIEGVDHLRDVYNAVDLFVLASKEDNLPLMGLEAMACGTPVVGYDVGGIPDYVRHGQTGLLARQEDLSDLGAKIRESVNDITKTRAMGQRAHEMIVQEFGSDREATAYETLYRSLVATNHHGDSVSTSETESR